MASYSANPNSSYCRAKPLFRSSALCQNSRVSEPGNKAESFCDWCLNIAFLFLINSSGLIGTAISISLIGHSCHAPRYNQTQQSLIHGSFFNSSNAIKMASRQTRCVPWWIRKVSSRINLVWLDLEQEILDDLDVLRAYRIFLYCSGFIEWQIKKMSFIIRQTCIAASGSCFTPSDQSLNFLHLRLIHFSSLFYFGYTRLPYRTMPRISYSAIQVHGQPLGKSRCVE
jgi:hypothetical protein